MKNVFLESHNIKNLNFGFGQFNYHLIKSIYNQQVMDFRMTLLVPSGNFLKKEFGNYFDYQTYHSLHRYPFFRIRKKYSLWHSLNQNTKVEPFHDIPYLLTIHNISYIQNPADYLQEKNHIRFQEKISRSSAITYISNYAKDSTHQFFDVPNVPEYVIYNGNPVTEILISPDYQPKMLPARPFLFTIGEISERKNFKSLIPLLARLKGFDLVIAGKDTTKAAEELRTSIRKFNLEKRVHLPGKISETDKQYYYQNCEAFVFPSLREGFGLPVIEAMRFGKPVFLSHNTSLPEIGKNLAFYWENYEPEEMQKILEKGLSSFRENEEFYVRESISHAQSFSWETAAKSYIEVYESLI